MSIETITNQSPLNIVDSQTKIWEETRRASLSGLPYQQPSVSHQHQNQPGASLRTISHRLLPRHGASILRGLSGLDDSSPDNSGIAIDNYDAADNYQTMCRSAL